MIGPETLHGRLIVSCQAPEGSPLRDPGIIAAIAEAAVLAGAGAVRVNSAPHVDAVRQRVDVPIIALEKTTVEGTQWITPTVDHARPLIDAGADIIAVDATRRPRHGLAPQGPLIPAIRGLGVSVMADVDDVRAGQHAAALGADFVATTLSGYTTATRTRSAGPDLELVRALAGYSRTPTVAEGRVQTPEQVADAFEAGAFAVVVGTSITDPLTLTARFLKGTPGSARESAD